MAPDSLNVYQGQIRKLVFWFCGLLVLFFVLRFAVHYITSGTITVTTGNTSATISISSAPSPSGAAKTTRQGKGSLTTRLPSGSYVVSVRYAASAANQLVHLGWRSNRHISTKQPRSATVEPVLYEGVQYLAADSNRMVFMASVESGGLEYINQDNEDVNIANTQTVNSVAWANAQYGIAQNSYGQLFVVDGTSVHRLQSPISFISDIGARYAVAPNRTIYIGLGSNVYRGTEAKGFKKIYTKFTTSDQLVAANDQVMIINPRDAQGNGTGVVVKTNGEVIGKTFGPALAGWTPWSQNGKHIVVTVGQEPELFDSSLHRVGVVPQPVLTNSGDSSHTSAVTGGSWLGDNTLFYYYAGQLWSYNLAQDISSVMATMPNSEIILSATVSADGSYVYLVTSTDGFTPLAIHRVGLRGQAVSQNFVFLQDFLPITAPEYTIGVRNFSGKPVIVVYPNPGSDSDDALQAAKSTLEGIIDVNNTEFDVDAET